MQGFKMRQCCAKWLGWLVTEAAAYSEHLRRVTLSSSFSLHSTQIWQQVVPFLWTVFLKRSLWKESATSNRQLTECLFSQSIYPPKGWEGGQEGGPSPSLSQESQKVGGESDVENQGCFKFLRPFPGACVTQQQWCRLYIILSSQYERLLFVSIEIFFPYVCFFPLKPP